MKDGGNELDKKKKRKEKDIKKIAERMKKQTKILYQI